jgi:hypothetical protein
MRPKIKRCYVIIRMTYEELGRLRGVSVHAVRKAVLRGKLDPRDLESVYRYAKKIREAKS